MAGLFGWFLVKKFKKSTQDFEKPILLWGSGIIGAFSIIVSIYLKFFTIDKTSEEVARILNSPNTQKIEGVISNFSRVTEQKRYGSVDTESFSVDSVNFSYSDALLGKFNSFGKTHNGVLYNGVSVRITYLKGNREYYDKDLQILKIEIGRE